MPTNAHGGSVRPAVWTTRLRSHIGWLMIALLSIAAAAALYDVMFGSRWWWNESRGLASAGLLGLAVALVIACSLGLRSLRPLLHRVVMSIGIWAAIAGWLCSLLPTWEVLASLNSKHSRLEHVFERLSTVAYVTSCAIALDALLHLMRIRGAAVWFRRIAIGAGYCTMTVCIAAQYIEVYDDQFERIGWSLLIICAAATIITVAMPSVFPPVRVGYAEPRDGESVAPITCPACATAQIVVLGRRIECPSCALGITLRLDPPRCACGYDLGGLTGKACPECGTPVESRHTWALAPQG